MSSTNALCAKLRADSKALGFDALGIVSPKSIPGAKDALKDFLDAGYHGSMDWMADTMERRSDPLSLWEDTRSIIVVAMNYGPETNPLAHLDRVHEGGISVYARHRDYHDVIKGKLKTLASKLLAHAKHRDLAGDVKVFVDTAPIMEKPLAHKAGIGWQGKHTNLVSRKFGSWLFLGSIFTTLNIEPDQGETDHCGKCSKCLDICPTDAFPAPYKLDARRCISYLTIEHKDPIPLEFRKAMGNRIYGCDDCLAICPWNKFASIASEAKLAASSVDAEIGLGVLLSLDDSGFRKRFSGSPVKRIGRNRFVRNCLIAAGNSNSEQLLPKVQILQNDADPVVREAADWAMQELLKERT